MPRSDGPFEVLEKVGPNAYKIDLPGDYGVSPTFNVADLSPYYDQEEEFPSLRSNSHQPGGYDGDHHFEPIEDHHTTPKVPNSIKEAREVQAMVRNVLEMARNTLPRTTGKWPGFVHLLGAATEGMMVCNDPSL